MTDRDWGRARLAALYLRLPELADNSAALRVLKTDALLKVTASFDPLKHPRWPKGSEEDHGGEFRPNDGDGVTPASDSLPDDIDPSDIQAHQHHWHDQALTDKYDEKGLLTPEAYDELKNSQEAVSEDIYQDVSNPDLRIHVYDNMHREASAEVRKISSDFLEEKGITKENPMTREQASELLTRIHSSLTPGISRLRQAIQEYLRSKGEEAKARRLEFRSTMPRSGASRKRHMPRPEEQATGMRVAERLHDNLLALGLEQGRDYWFYVGGNPYRYTVIGFCDRKSLTPAVVIACHKAVADEHAWGIRMDLIDPDTGKLQPFATANPHRWTLCCHEKWARDLGRETDDQMRAARIGAWRNLPAD